MQISVAVLSDSFLTARSEQAEKIQVRSLPTGSLIIFGMNIKVMMKQVKSDFGLMNALCSKSQIIVFARNLTETIVMADKCAKGPSCSKYYSKFARSSAAGMRNLHPHLKFESSDKVKLGYKVGVWAESCGGGLLGTVEVGG